jgi:hypothetical protein
VRVSSNQPEARRNSILDRLAKDGARQLLVPCRGSAALDEAMRLGVLTPGKRRIIDSAHAEWTAGGCNPDLLFNEPAGVVNTGGGRPRATLICYLKRLRGFPMQVGGRPRSTCLFKEPGSPVPVGVDARRPAIRRVGARARSTRPRRGPEHFRYRGGEPFSPADTPGVPFPSPSDTGGGKPFSKGVVPVFFTHSPSLRYRGGSLPPHLFCTHPCPLPPPSDTGGGKPFSKGVVPFFFAHSRPDDSAPLARRLAWHGLDSITPLYAETNLDLQADASLVLRCVSLCLLGDGASHGTAGLDYTSPCGDRNGSARRRVTCV